MSAYHQYKLRVLAVMGALGLAGLALTPIVVIHYLGHEVPGRGDAWDGWYALSIIVAVLVLGGLFGGVGMLFTTPDQDRQLAKHQGTAAKGRAWKLLDPNDPDYYTPTWRYLLRMTSPEAEAAKAQDRQTRTARPPMPAWRHVLIVGCLYLAVCVVIALISGAPWDLRSVLFIGLGCFVMPAFIVWKSQDLFPETFGRYLGAWILHAVTLVTMAAIGLMVLKDVPAGSL